MKYISGPYTQGQLLRDIVEIENALTERFLRGGVITDAAEQRSWRERVQDASFGRNTVMYDDLGNPSVMVVVNALTEADLLTGGRNMPHPAFIVNGVIRPVIYVAKYQCITTGSGTTLRALSLRGVDPANGIIFGDALLACKQKGAGWHLMTNAEWAAIALWCKTKNFWPRGNNSYGKDYSITSEKGVPSHYYDSGGAKYIGRTLTGSGPLPWSHDGSPFGIFDLNGNVWEWVGGLRLKIGEIQVLQDNNAADNTKDQSDTSTEWKAILQDGSLVAPGTVDTLKFDSPAAGDGVGMDNLGAPTLSTTIVNSGNPGNPADNGYYDYNYTVFETLTAQTGVTIPNLLKLLAVAPIDSAHGGDGLWVRNYGERLPLRGGCWDIGSLAGVCALHLTFPRSAVETRIGFRAAFA